MKLVQLVFNSHRWDKGKMTS